jgi:hypothetical protein
MTLGLGALKKIPVAMAVLGCCGSAMALDIANVLQGDRTAGIAAVTSPLQASKVSDLEAVYDLSDVTLGGRGRKAFYLSVPAQFAGKKLESLSLTHRQDPQEERECRSGDRDCLPAYVSLEVYDVARRDHNWRYWGGTGSGPFNSKFAEIRDSRGETDNLYEWQRKGHYAVDNGADFAKVPVEPGFLRLRSVGPDEAHIQQVVLKMDPPNARNLTEYIFARGLRFGDFITADGRRYPGHAAEGDYGDALLLDSRHHPRHAKLDKSWNNERGSFRIPLKAGTKLVAVDIACGDMKPVPWGADPEKYRGNSYVTVRRWVHGQPVENLISNRNVGSNGVIRATSEKIDRVAGYDEEIEIKADRGSVSIMGVRLGAF